MITTLNTLINTNLIIFFSIITYEFQVQAHCMLITHFILTIMSNNERDYVRNGILVHCLQHAKLCIMQT